MKKKDLVGQGLSIHPCNQAREKRRNLEEEEEEEKEENRRGKGKEGKNL